MKTKRNRTARSGRSGMWGIGAAIAALVLSFVAYGRLSQRTVDQVPQPLQLHAQNAVAARQRAAELIAYEGSITLSPKQKRTMDEALSSIPAPCCSRYSIATCCCPCNLAKSAWGLSKHLIAHEQAEVSQVKAAVNEWLAFANPDSSFTGDACFTRRCERPFHDNGCGGMDANQIR